MKINKRKRTIALLLAVLLLCSGTYAGLAISNAGSGDGTEEPEYLLNFTGLESIRVQHQDETLSFYKDNGEWYYAEDGEFPLDQESLFELEDALLYLTAQRSFSADGELERYGLLEPSLTIDAMSTEGQTALVEVGNSNESIYYIRLDGQETIYTIESTLAALARRDLLDLIRMEEFPWFDEENLQAVTVAENGETSSLTKETVQVEKETMEDTGETDEDGNPIYEAAVEHTEAFRWTHVTESGSRLLAEEEELAALEDYFYDLYSLSFSSCVAYKPDAEALAGYGFDSAAVLSVSYGYLNNAEGETAADHLKAEEFETFETVELQIGDYDDLYGSYYVYFTGSDRIYLMNGDAVERIMNMELTA